MPERAVTPPTTVPNRSLAPLLLAEAALFVVGAIAGTVGDQIHVQLRVLHYPSPRWWLLGQAAWVPLLFGCAGLALVNGQAVFQRLVPKSERFPARGIILQTLLFYLAYLSTGLFQDSPRLLAAGLTIAWVIRVALRPSLDRVLGSLTSAVGGCVFEATLSSTGAFLYRAPDFLHIPLWLGPLYLHVALMTRYFYFAFIAPALPKHNEAP